MTRRRPILLGIVGDSAAGKTTITQGLMNILGADCVTHVCTDDYHKYDRQERAAARHHAVAPRVQLHRRAGTAPGAPALRSAHPQAGVRPRHRHAGAAGVRPAAAVRHRRGLAGFFHADAAAVLRRQGVPGPAGRHAEGFGNSAAIRPGAATPPTRCWRNWSAASPTRATSSARSASTPTSSCGSIRPTGLSPEAAGPHLNVRLVLRPTIPHPDLSYLGPSVNSCSTATRTPLRAFASS